MPPAKRSFLNVTKKLSMADLHKHTAANGNQSWCLSMATLADILAPLMPEGFEMKLRGTFPSEGKVVLYLGACAPAAKPDNSKEARTKRILEALTAAEEKSAAAYVAAVQAKEYTMAEVEADLANEPVILAAVKARLAAMREVPMPKPKAKAEGKPMPRRKAA